MRGVRVLDLDGSLRAQAPLFPEPVTSWVPAREWGPKLRLACSFRTYSLFRRWLGHASPDNWSGITFYGSGDFHHVTLAFLEQLPGPFNLLAPDPIASTRSLGSGGGLRRRAAATQGVGPMTRSAISGTGRRP